MNTHTCAFPNMSPTHANDTIFLLTRLQENEAARLSYWLYQNGPIAERGYFSLELPHTTAQVLQRIVDRKIPVEMVVKAIDLGVGNRNLAHNWLSSIASSTMSAEAFMNVPGRIALVEDSVITDMEFNDFCNKLGLSPSLRMRLSQNRDNRVPSALREWYRIAPRSVDDLKACLSQFSYALVSRLGFDSASVATVAGTPTETYNQDADYKNKIYNLLTPDQKQEILLNAGLPNGMASTIATIRGVADFWAALANQGKTHDVNTWRDYPACQRLLGLAPVQCPSIMTTLAPSVSSASAPLVLAPYTRGVPATSGSSSSKIGQAFQIVQAKKDVTVRDFFTATDGAHNVAANKLIAALDETELWELVLSDQGLLENPEVAAEVVQRQKAWIEDQISPTKLMLNDLLDTEWGSQSMKEFAEYLKSKGNEQINGILDAWNSKVEGKILSAQKAGIKRFETAKTLNQFFMDLVDDDNVFTPELIPGLVAKLQSDHITTVKLLGKLKDEHFEKYGLKMGQIILVREALDAMAPAAVPSAPIRAPPPNKMTE